jgi:hypothetical protein
MTIADRFIHEFGTSRLSDDRGHDAIAWMATTDPDGAGYYDAPARAVVWQFTDGSSVVLDCHTASFAQPN